MGEGPPWFEVFVDRCSYVVKWDTHFPGDSLLLPDCSWELIWEPCTDLSAWLYHIPYVSSVWLLPRWFSLVNGEHVASAIGFLSLSACFHFHSQGKAFSRLLHFMPTFLENCTLDPGDSGNKVCSGNRSLWLLPWGSEPKAASTLKRQKHGK